MKHLLFAIVALLGIVACNKKTESDKSSVPKVTGVVFSTNKISGQTQVSADVYSEYGLSSIVVAYRVDDASQVKYASPDYIASESVTTRHYTGTIPSFKAGTKIRFEVVAISYYDNVSGRSDSYTYVCPDTEQDIQPDPID